MPTARLSWEEVECQGACVNAPMVMIGKDTYEDLTPERLEEIIDAFEAGNGKSITPGPQIDRVYSAPVGGPTTLLDGKSGKQAPARKTAGKTAGKQAMTKAAKPKSAAPEGRQDYQASPDKAKGPGRTKASKAAVDKKTEDAGPTLKVASTRSPSRRSREEAGRKDRFDSGNPTMKLAAHRVQVAAGRTAAKKPSAAAKKRNRAAANPLTRTVPPESRKPKAVPTI
jgi:NADH-quinone oxidoreductase subunit E